MKKLLGFVVSAVFSQTDAEFFSFSYKPGESTPTTTIALGTAAQKYNIQYKKWAMLHGSNVMTLREQ